MEVLKPTAASSANTTNNKKTNQDEDRKSKKQSLVLNIAICLFAVGAVCFVVHFLFFRYSFPPVNVDEGSFFSPAYSFATHGRLSSDIHQSFLPGSAKYTYWMPPLYLVVLGSFLKMVGATVLNAKLLSFLFTCLSAYLISTLVADKFAKIILSGLLLICPFVIITSAFIRVEALAILLIVVSIVAVKFKWNHYLLGIIAGLGLMTHPLLVPCACALALVTMLRGWKAFFIFSIIVLITLSPYIFYILQDVNLFKQQMGLQLMRKSQAKFSNLKVQYIVQSVPMVLVALFCLFKLEKREIKYFLAVAIIFSLFIVLRSNEFNYQVYLVPYVIASIGLLVVERKTNVYRFGIPFLMFTFFALMLASKFLKYNKRSDAEYKQLIAYLENNRTWQGKNIFEAGGPDVSSFLMQNNQHVEREIPIAINKKQDWFAKYNYVVDVVDHNEAKNDAVTNKNDVKPWNDWNKTTFTTSKGSISMFLYSRP